MQKCAKANKSAGMQANGPKALKNVQKQTKAFESTQKCMKMQKCEKNTNVSKSTQKCTTILETAFYAFI